MKIPGFTAEASLGKGSRTYLAMISRSTNMDQQTVIPQFCWCECHLQQFCYRLPPSFVRECFTVGTFCIPHGTCPSGYCGGFHSGL
jgi:hypothetical protein